jgi:hypothetical protein
MQTETLEVRLGDRELTVFSTAVVRMFDLDPIKRSRAASERTRIAGLLALQLGGPRTGRKSMIFAYRPWPSQFAWGGKTAPEQGDVLEPGGSFNAIPRAQNRP